MPPYFRFRVGHPIFFRRGKRETQEIRGSGNETTTAHAHAKNGALEQAWWRVTGGGQPLANLIREPCSRQIRLHRRLNFVRQLHAEQIRGKANSSVQHAFRSYCFRGIRNAIPVDARLPRDQPGDVGDPH